MRERAGWFSWRIVCPWSLGLIGLFAAAHFVLAWAIEREVVHRGEERVGACVEVGDTRVNLLAGRLATATSKSPIRCRRSEILSRPNNAFSSSTPTHYSTNKPSSVTASCRALRFGTSRETSGRARRCRRGSEPGDRRLAG